ncbi:hypothetical protein ASAP_0261 [Asaia bogorensis]|uniref:Uncharacterized protein n=1 Tax=Asaia bogorensis TaxID=91915 RepID=A0A060QGB6_9PROT|nr:hypothetical protein ASAP_0261 [Asaia bogorensis]
MRIVKGDGRVDQGVRSCHQASFVWSHKIIGFVLIPVPKSPCETSAIQNCRPTAASVAGIEQIRCS